MSVSNFETVPYPKFPIANVTPFTYRDGHTYLELIEQLRNHLASVVEGHNVLVETINTFFDDTLDSFEEFKFDVVEDVEQFKTDINNAWAAHLVNLNATVVDALNAIAELSNEDDVIGFIIDDSLSTTRKAILDSVQREIPNPVSALSANNTRWFHMNEQGHIFRQGGAKLHRSVDGGETFTEIGEFTSSISGVRELSNGELLVGVGSHGGLWKTTGYPDSGFTWARVLMTDVVSHGWTLAWGFSNHNNIVVVAPYDATTPPNRGASQPVYLSTDYGETWTLIYEHGQNAGGQHHIHGVCYDPYRGAIWLSTGDGPGRALRVSWDMGVSWELVANVQPTVIYAFPECVVFGTDEAPNGMWRIDKPTPDNLRITTAHLIDGGSFYPTTYNLTHIAQSWFKKKNGPLLVPFTTVDSGRTPVVLASYDGYSWWELWRATGNVTNGGITNAIGPDDKGQYFLTSPSGKAIVVDEPGIVTHVSRAARQSAIEKTSVHVGAWKSGESQSVPGDGSSTFKPKLAPSNSNRDVFEAFSLNSGGDGVIINRNCFGLVSASFTRDTTSIASTTLQSPFVYIYRNGQVAIFSTSETATTPIILQKGDVISVRLGHWTGTPEPLDSGDSNNVLNIMAIELG